MSAAYPWDRPLGARRLDQGHAGFRVWAPNADEVRVRLGEEEVALEESDLDVYEAVVAVHGEADYWFVLNGQALPDPCSRWQPDGLRGPSRVVSAGTPPPLAVMPSLAGLVIYELHVGTFTQEGTFAAAAAHMRELAELGVDAIEIMPVAEFPGRRGWGYDGVYLSAAQSSYGGPHGLSELVGAAHGAGLAVILDVVYNHIGASGVTALEAFGPYFTDAYETPWGRAINFDQRGCDPVREWVLQSAAGWVADFGIDGLRLDAIWAIFDSSPEHIVAAVARRVHEVRDSAFVIAESGLNDPRVMRPRERGGYACDAAWSDDFHHALRTLLTEERDGYYAEFGSVSQLAKAYHRPHVHDGDYSIFRGRRFGAPAEDIAPERFVVFDQNHDQVGNRAFGDRLPPDVRPLAALCTLLSPFAVLLFQGEEYGEEAPFQFFSDHIDEEIAEATRKGRREEFAAFSEFGAEGIPDPQDLETFDRSKLTRRRDPEIERLYRELIGLREELEGAAVDAIAFDEESRWLRVGRGRFEIVASFAGVEQTVPCRDGRVRLATALETAVEDGAVRLAPMSGAVVEAS